MSPPTTHQLVTKIDKQLSTHLALSEVRWEQVDKHEKTLYGNRRLGVVSSVRLLMWLLGLLATIGCGIAVAAVTQVFGS